MNDNKKINKAVDIMENDIFGGIDRLFHALNAEKGYQNEHIRAYGEALKKALPEYIDKELEKTECHSQNISNYILENLKKRIEGKD